MPESFLEKIDKRVAVAKRVVQEQNEIILNPMYHSKRVSLQLREWVTAIEPETPQDQIVQALLSIVNRIPAYVGSGFNESIQNITAAKKELNLLVAIRNEWLVCDSSRKEEEERKKNREKKVLAAVEDGLEEKEPTDPRHTGLHPGPSTREIRIAKAKLRETDS